jgi:hypothetical protein
MYKDGCFLVVVQCNLVKVYRRFCGTFCPYLEDDGRAGDGGTK